MWSTVPVSVTGPPCTASNFPPTCTVTVEPTPRLKQVSAASGSGMPATTASGTFLASRRDRKCVESPGAPAVGLSPESAMNTVRSFARSAASIASSADRATSWSNVNSRRRSHIVCASRRACRRASGRCSSPSAVTTTLAPACGASAQPDGQRDLAPDRRPHGPHLVGLTAPDVLHEHGAVQDKADPIEGAGAPEVLQQFGPQVHVRALLDDTRRAPRVRDQDRDRLEVELLGRGGEALELEHLAAAKDSEVLHRLRHRRKRQCLVTDPGDPDPHGVLLSSWRLIAT